MTFSSAHSRMWLAICLFLLLGSATAQRSSGSILIPPRRPSDSNSSSQPAFISGKVQLEGSGAPGEPVALERVCGGSVRLVGYTDSKGQFQVPFASNSGFQDASENDPNTGQAPGAQGSMQPLPQSQIQSQIRRSANLVGCELRAVFAGFQSSAVLIRTEGNSWVFDVGTIVLKRMESAPGTTISLTSLNAPSPAMHAYQKAQRAAAEQKLAEAAKELEKAVQIYPQFAAAWTMLGDLHAQANQLAQARAEYTQALAADPQFVNPCFKLVLVSSQEKKWEEALQFAEKAEGMNASAYPSIYFYGAVANFNLHRLPAAEESAKKFKSLDTEHLHPDVALLLSLLLERRLDYVGAAQQLREYLAAVPNAPNAEALQEKARRLESLNVAEQVRKPQ